RVETTNGGLNVTLPASAAFELRAATTNGNIRTDFPVTIEGTFGPKNVSGTVGGGGRELKLATTNGGIEIRKSGAEVRPSGAGGRRGRAGMFAAGQTVTVRAEKALCGARRDKALRRACPRKRDAGRDPSSSTSSRVHRDRQARSNYSGIAGAEPRKAR